MAGSLGDPDSPPTHLASLIWTARGAPGSLFGALRFDGATYPRRNDRGKRDFSLPIELPSVGAVPQMLDDVPSRPSPSLGSWNGRQRSLGALNAWETFPPAFRTARSPFPGPPSFAPPLRPLASQEAYSRSGPAECFYLLPADAGERENGVRTR